MEISSEKWLSSSTLENYVLHDIYMYYSDIESYKSNFDFELEKYSSKVYIDDMSIKQMVCNERYIFVLVKFKSNYNVLFVMDTTLPTDSYKIYDKAYGEPCWQNANLDEINLTRPNEMKTIYIRDDDNERIKLYCVQDSSDEQCVLISENQIHLYKNGTLYVHDYSFTVKNVFIEIDKLVLYDEFNVQYTYLFSNDSPVVKHDSSNVIYNFIKYDNYNNIRIDQKGTRYRVTYIDKIPSYVMLPIYSDETYYNNKCLSKNICSMQTDSTSLVYLLRNDVQ